MAYSVIMYHRIVAQRVRGTFSALNDGDAEAMVRGLAPRFRYRFHGDHALAGERSNATTIRAWWERVFRLFPHLRFHPTDVVVAGWPWDTRVATSVVVATTLMDGTPYRNQMMQFMRLRWGRIIEIETLEDTQHLAAILAGLAAAGVDEATALPLTDAVSAGAPDHRL